MYTCPLIKTPIYLCYLQHDGHPLKFRPNCKLPFSRLLSPPLSFIILSVSTGTYSAFVKLQNLMEAHGLREQLLHRALTTWEDIPQEELIDEKCFRPHTFIVFKAISQ